MHDGRKRIRTKKKRPKFLSDSGWPTNEYIILLRMNMAQLLTRQSQRFSKKFLLKSVDRRTKKMWCIWSGPRLKSFQFSIPQKTSIEVSQLQRFFARPNVAHSKSVDLRILWTSRSSSHKFWGYKFEKCPVGIYSLSIHTGTIPYLQYDIVYSMVYTIQ